MHRSPAHYAVALLAVVGVAWLTTTFLPALGLASAALLFLVPVLFIAANGGFGPGLLAALLGATAYNYFLLPPRFTLRIHGLDNVVSVVVLVAVALVTSHLATRLKAREAEALELARKSEELADLSGVLSSHPAATAMDRGLALIAENYGFALIINDTTNVDADAAFSALDAAAAAWSAHNGDTTGHGTEVMPAADWTFLPLSAKNRRSDGIAAVARPTDGRSRTPDELGHLGQLSLLLGQCRDRDAFEAKRRDSELLAESDRLRRTMLAALAHDFRTPLTVISGRLAALSPDSVDAHEALLATRRLERMMNDLLGAARIEAGQLSPAMDQIDLVDAISAACDGLIVPTDVALTRHIQADLPFVVADPVLLQHILTNLIENALQHANGKVMVEAQHADAQVLVTVNDDGPGIPEDQRARIFDRFARIEGNDRTGGSGLGLSIVKGFASAMDMSVHVSSSPSGGARFALGMAAAEMIEA